MVLALLAAEVGTRVLSDVAAPVHVPDPVIGRRYLRDFDGWRHVPERGGRVHLRFNRDGMRGPDRRREPVEGVRRVAVVGDSMVVSVATDEEDTFPSVLERELPGGPLRWEVLNFGVSGSSTGQELVLYRELASSYRPDVVVLAFCNWNDLGDNSRELTGGPRIYHELDGEGRLVQLPFAPRRAVASLWLNRHSRFYAWQKQALQGLRERGRESARGLQRGEWIFCVDPPPPAVRAWAVTDALLRRFRAEVEADGARFLVVALPSAEQVYDEAWAALVARAGPWSDRIDPDEPERRLAELCRAAGIELLTLTERFRAAVPGRSAAAVGELLHYRGRGHLTPRGHRIVALALEERLADVDSPP